MPHELESPGAVGRRRGNSKVNGDDQALDQIAKEGEKMDEVHEDRTGLNLNNNNEEKLVLTIKVNQNEADEFLSSTPISLSDSHSSSTIVHVSGPESRAVSSPVSASRNISVCSLNEDATKDEETTKDEEFAFSDEDFETTPPPEPEPKEIPGLVNGRKANNLSIVDVCVPEPDVTSPRMPEDDSLIAQFFDKSTDIAEARLAARRAARAEAREIRMRELERQQKEQEQNADRAFDMQQQSAASNADPIMRSRLTAVNSLRGGANSSLNSRRSSEDSVEDEGRSLRDLRHELKDVEERFRKAMITNAQLDNERASQTYQIQLLKDKLEEMEETYAQLQREFREKSRDHDNLKRNNERLTEELRLTTGQLTERDQLIAEQGLTIVLIENEEGTDARRALVSVENAHLLGTVQGSLDVRLRRFADEKSELQEEISKLRQQLHDTKSRGRRSSSMNGVLDDDEYEDAQREANKLLTEYKYKLQKAEQEIASLQASLARSETQVIRYKSTAEAAEKAEGELKIERRKLQRENREAMERLEELETSHNHLLKRLDKLKNAKSALLKDL